jgi:hypothetical protein
MIYNTCYTYHTVLFKIPANQLGTSLTDHLLLHGDMSRIHDRSFESCSDGVMQWWNKRDDPANIFPTNPCDIIDDLRLQEGHSSYYRKALEKTVDKRRKKLNPCFYSVGQVRTEAKDLQHIEWFTLHETRINAKRKTFKHMHTRDACPHCRLKHVRIARRLEDAAQLDVKHEVVVIS